MKVFVVTCFMEGCEECGNEYHVVGAFHDEVKAKEVAKQHEEESSWENRQCDNPKGHLHSCSTKVDEVEVQ